MAEKPSKNKQIEIDYRLYHKLEKEAIESDKTIKEVAEKYLRNDSNEPAENLKREKDRLENEVEKLKKENRNLKKDQEKKREEDNWEGFDKERLVDILLDLDGVGEQTAYKVAAKLMATDWWRIQFNQKIYKEWKE